MTGKATEDNASGPLLGLGLSEGLGHCLRSERTKACKH